MLIRGAHRRDGGSRTAWAHDGPIDGGRRHEDRRDGAWEAEAWDRDEAWGEPARPRRGLFRRLFSLVKLAMFALPLAVFLYGSFADCGARPAFADWLGALRAGACARNEIIDAAFSLPDNLAALTRLVR